MDDQQQPVKTPDVGKTFSQMLREAEEAIREQYQKSGWNKTLDDLQEELRTKKRRFITGLETRLAREYEISLLPEGTRFPKEGEVYEATEDFPVNFVVLFSAPVSGGSKYLLAKGERVRVQSVWEEKPLGVSCLPLDYERLEPFIVSDEDRRSERYSNYYLVIKTADLNRFFRLMTE